MIGQRFHEESFDDRFSRCVFSSSDIDESSHDGRTSVFTENISFPIQISARQYMMNMFCNVWF